MNHGHSNAFWTYSKPAPGTGLRTSWYRETGKRVLDIILVLALAPVGLAIIAIVGAVVRVSGSKPFYSHERVGLGGRTFMCLKIQTMVPDADERLQAMLESDPNAAAEWKERQKVTNDPRVTRIGRFLRASAIDELPQLLNVLRGDMSLVGPRPVTPGEFERLGPAQNDYVTVRPGITGLWQVSGRGIVDTNERIALERSYIRKVTFFGDIGILMRTGVAIMARPGE